MPVELDIESYFRGYARAFDAFDLDELCSYFHRPSLMVASAGAAVLATDEEIRANTSAILENHRAAGFARAEVVRAVGKQIGSALAEATVDWRVLRDDGSELWAFANSYTLIEIGSRWRIAVSTTHDL